MTNLQILNGSVLYIAVILGLLFIAGLAFVFFKKSWDRALELGYSKDVLKRVIKSSVIFTIIPSLAIVIALFSLVSVLGIPWSWFRLSVIGSLAYELMAAEMTVTGLGFSSLGEFTATGEISAISSIMFVMSLCAISWVIFTMLFAKKLQTGMVNFQQKNDKWGALAMSYFMLSIAVVFLPIQVSLGAVHLATLLTSTLVAFIHLVVIQKFGVKWLSEFILANSLIIGMVSAVLWDQLFM